MAQPPAQIGLIGLAVMGQNLALNIADHGHRIAVYNRTPAVTNAFLDTPGISERVSGSFSLQDFVQSLERPRKVIIMVRAGSATDAVIEELSPLLDDGDLIIDCGNSHYADTERRGQWLSDRGKLFIGSGVSGGEEGARTGPSIMPGGDPGAWPLVETILTDISAKVDGEPCCAWLGEGGAGHYVKMVHNGIEYGDMQLIAEAYHLMKSGLGLSHDKMADVFRQWQKGRLDSYLIEITADILAYRDEHGEPLLEKVLDAAGQKGTGKWTGISSLEFGVPVSLISEAVYARCLSALTELRSDASSRLRGPDAALTPKIDQTEFLNDLEQALFASKVVSYTQGFMLLREASLEHKWALDMSAVAALWRGGCIIRSVFLNDICAAFKAQPELPCLALADYFEHALNEAQLAWRKVVSTASLSGIAVPGLSSALSFYDGLRCARSPANMLQAQRDYFGGHTYERVDAARGKFFHTDWTGRGGQVSSSTYNV